MDFSRGSRTNTREASTPRTRTRTTDRMRLRTETDAYRWERVVGSERSIVLCDRDRWWCVRGHVIIFPSRKTSVHVRATLPMPCRAQTAFVVSQQKQKKAKMSAESHYLPPSPQSSALPFAPKTALSNISAVENASSAFREDQSPPRSILPAWRAAQSVVCRCPTADPLHRRPIVRALPARVSRANPAVLPPQTAPFPLCLRRHERDDITTRCVSCDPRR